jgi:DNA-directed RNA polymerase specialized sigma24 family protein
MEAAGNPISSHPREFTTTRWSVVLRAGGSSPEEARAALEQLCRDYWFPLYAYVRRKGHTPEDASDLTQEFFARLLANDFAQGVTPDGGRFRSFLLVSMNRFLVDEWRRSKAAKRGGDVFVGSLEAMIEERGEAGYVGEIDPSATPEQIYQRAWAETLLGRVLGRLRDEYLSRGGTRFAEVEPFLTFGAEPPGLEEAAAGVGLGLTAFKSLLHRLRVRYRELLTEEVRQTLGPSGEVEDELRGVLQALREGR